MQTGLIHQVFVHKPKMVVKKDTMLMINAVHAENAKKNPTQRTAKKGKSVCVSLWNTLGTLRAPVLF
jgi:hypothetical protein